MAPGWEPVRTRESFELDITPPPRRRHRPNKRFIFTGGITLLLVILYFTSSHLRRTNAPVQEQATFKEPSVVDTPHSEQDPAPSSPTAVAFPPHVEDNPLKSPEASPEPIPPNDVEEFIPAEPTIPVSIQTGAPPPPQPTSQLSTTKAAVILESRSFTNLIPIILHFSSILGPEWPIHIFTDGSNAPLFVSSPAFQRGIRDGRFRIRSILAGTDLTTPAGISDFFTNPWLWEEMAPAEHILIFQTDSIICANSPQKVEYFFEYDFVGAPIDTGKSVSYNGRLSLRNRSMSLEITKQFDWQAEQYTSNSTGDLVYEDQWFSEKMRSVGANLPTTEVALEFSVESIWYDKPLGYHLPSIWLEDKMGEIEKWCPEIKMCTTEATET